MKSIIKILLFLLLSSFGASIAQAAKVAYDIINISGNTWQYDYSIENDTLANDIEEFSIFFDYNLYENLQSAVAPADWDPLIIQPDTGLPDDGFLDILALVSGIAPGDTLGGFSIQFDFLGIGTPGSQSFDIIDPFTFATIESGTTQLMSSGINPVPLPAAFWLFVSWIVPLFARCEYYRRKKLV